MDTLMDDPAVASKVAPMVAFEDVATAESMG